MSGASGGLTTGGSIGGGMNIDIVVLQDMNLSFENLQKSKNLGAVTDPTPVGTINKLANSIKGMKDVIALSSLTPTTSLSPPVTPIGAGTKISGIMNRRG